MPRMRVRAKRSLVYHGDDETDDAWCHVIVEGSYGTCVGIVCDEWGQWLLAVTWDGFIYGNAGVQSVDQDVLPEDVIFEEIIHD